MGSMVAMGYADAVTDGLCSLRQAVYAHLTSNMYPPVGIMLEPSLRAIAKAKRGQWDARVRLPDGVTYKGKKLAPVSEVISAHHLEFFLPSSEEEE